MSILYSNQNAKAEANVLSSKQMQNQIVALLYTPALKHMFFYKTLVSILSAPPQLIVAKVYPEANNTIEPLHVISNRTEDTSPSRAF